MQMCVVLFRQSVDLREEKSWSIQLNDFHAADVVEWQE